MAKKTSTYLTDRTLAIVGDGDSLSGQLNRIVDRYAEICERMDVEARFTAAELDALRDVARSWFAEPAATIAGGLAAEVKDAGEELADAFDVDVPALLAMLRTLTYAEEVALVDAIERYWRRVGAEG